MRILTCCRLFCDFLRRFRILNGVYRGHIVSSAAFLTRTLKIIMHSNYIYTRDHQPRNHQPFDLDLDELNDVDAPPDDPDHGTGYTVDDFNVGDRVLMWLHRTWWHAKVCYKSRAGTLSVRLVGSRDAVSGILPDQLKPDEH